MKVILQILCIGGTVPAALNHGGGWWFPVGVTAGIAYCSAIEAFFRWRRG